MERFTPRDIEEALKLGGSDIDEWQEYEVDDLVPYCDKGGHRERSVANQPQHNNHWKKVERDDYQ